MYVLEMRVTHYGGAIMCSDNNQLATVMVETAHTADAHESFSYIHQAEDI